jgi:hypothetical protein
MLDVEMIDFVICQLPISNTESSGLTQIDTISSLIRPERAFSDAFTKYIKVVMPG